MNQVFKKIFSKSLGRIVVVSEHAKSAGKTDNMTGNSDIGLSDKHHQHASRVVVLPRFIIHSLVLSLAAISGTNVWAGLVCTTAGTTTGSASTASGRNATACGVGNNASGESASAFGLQNIASGFGSSALGFDNMASGDYSFAGGVNNFAQQQGATAVGGATGISYENITYDNSDNPTKITKINGIAVTATSTDLDSITAINGVSVTSDQLEAFLNALENGGSLALGTNSTTVGSQNLAIGNNSSAVGTANTASGERSSAVGYGTWQVATIVLLVVCIILFRDRVQLRWVAQVARTMQK